MPTARSTPRTRSQPTAALQRAVAASVDAPVALLPHLPDLFADLTALGSNPRLVVSILRGRGFGPRHRVLDMACGKGAVSISIARSLRCRCTGVDAFEPFIRAANDAAVRSRVQDRCAFTTGDVTRYRARGTFDGGLMLGLFPAPRAAKLLRRHVRRGGVYIIDDAAAVAGAESAGLHTVEQTTRAIERLGDRVERVIVFPPSRTRRLNDSLYRRIARRARALKQRLPSPTLRRAIDDLLERQRLANEELSSRLRPAIWVVSRR